MGHFLEAFHAMFNQRCDVTVPFPYTHARTTDTTREKVYVTMGPPTKWPPAASDTTAYM